MEQLLNDWGFAEYIEIFRDQEIDEDSLLCLNVESIKELIPKVGPRMKFWSKLNQYQQIMAIPIVVPILPKHDINNISPHTVSAVNLDEHEQILDNTDFLMLSPTSSPSSTRSSTPSVLDDPNIVKQSFESSTKRPMAFCGADMFKKACRNVYNVNIREFLEKTVTGKFILHSDQKEQKLTRALRSQLSMILISGLMSENRENLIPVDFEILCDKICQLFPTETRSTYYIPRVPGNKTLKPVNPRGKLIDKYRNLRKIYLENPESHTAVTEDLLDSQATSTCDALQEYANWLKANNEPWDLVIDNWKKSFPIRKIGSKSPTIAEFLNDWPILKHKNAYALIDLDFQELYPDCQISSLLNEYQKWEQFFNTLKNINALDKTTTQFLTLLNSDAIGQDCKNAIQVAALPKLFPPKGRIRGKKHWKPSVIECQESIINLISTCGEIQEVIQHRTTKVAELGITDQPYMIAVGAEFSSITETYVVIDKHVYQTVSVLQSVDFLFKAFHVLNACYPSESEHIWLLIERKLYKIQHSDIKMPAVLTMLKDFENIK